MILLKRLYSIGKVFFVVNLKPYEIQNKFTNVISYLFKTVSKTAKKFKNAI
jgi:hypothetical protein